MLNTRKTLLFATKALTTTIALSMTLLLLQYPPVLAGDGVELGRWRIIPLLGISERFSDNIYLEDRDVTDDYITSITPELTLDLAVVPKNYFSLRYRGEFLSYAEADNFVEDHHLGSLSFNSSTSKGSHLVFGVSAENTAIQPFSQDEESKEYLLQEAYADILLIPGKVTEIGAEYTHSEREFNEREFADDEYVRDRWDFHLLYKRSLVLPLLLQYRYIVQDNNDQGAINTDFQSHTLFLGARWRPVMKLSGALRIGYTWAQFDESNVDDFNGYAVDTNLVYAFSEITRFTLIAEHAIQQPTQSARESGDYFVFSKVGLGIAHRKWERITTRLNFLYKLRDYREIQGSETIREDDYYKASLSIEYAMRNWIAFSLGYHHQQNNSDIESEAYTENSIMVGIDLSM